MTPFKNKNCIITGGASGMGFETAKKMAATGANIALIDLNEEALHRSSEALIPFGTNILPITADLSKTKQIRKAFFQIETQFKSISMLINCAGISTTELLLDIDESTWDLEMNINLKSIMLLSQLTARNMIENKVENGRIISIASQSGKHAEAKHGAYCVSKAGVIMLTKVLALELAEYGITVNAVAPGIVDTPMIHSVIEKLGVPEEIFQAKMANDIPLKRMALPEEIADLIMFLASDKASYITGITTTIAGGTTLD